MDRRRTSTTVFAAVLSAVAVLGAAACSSSETTTSATTATTTAAATTSEAAAPADLDAPAAQEILRTVVDASTTPDAAAGLIASDDPSIGQQINGFARGAGQAGYTPDVFTISSVEAIDDATAEAQGQVASPHAPAPIAMTFGFVKQGDEWKLAADSVTQLLSMGQGAP